MDYNFVQSFVHTRSLDQPSFDFLISSHLLKNAHFRPHDFSKYFFGLFFGFTLIIHEIDLRNDLGITDSYFKILPETSGFKFVFFVNFDGRLSMNIRNVFFTKDLKNRGLSVEEYEDLRRRVIAGIENCREDIEEYIVQPLNIYKTGKSNSRTAFPVILKKLKTDGRSVLKKAEDQRVADLESTGFKRFEQLLTDSLMENTKPMQMAMNFFKMQLNQKFIERTKSFLSHIVMMHQVAQTTYNLQLSPWNGADCGFTHGVFLALRQQLSLTPVVIHSIVEPQSGHESSGLQGRFYLSLKQNCEHGSGWQHLLNPKPGITISFTQDSTGELDWSMMEKLGWKNAMVSKRILVKMNMEPGRTNVLASVCPRMSLENFAADIYDFTHDANNDVENFQRIRDHVLRVMNNILHTEIAYNTQEVLNYASRYFLSMMLTAKRPTHLEIFVAQPNNEQETTFIIESETSGSKIMIKFLEYPIDENQRMDIDEDISSLAPKPGMDTTLVTIKQTFQNAETDFLEDEQQIRDFINREISIQMGNYDDLCPTQMKKIHIRSIKIDKPSVTESSARQLQDIISKYHPFMKNIQEMKAFMDGLFYKTPHLTTSVTSGTKQFLFPQGHPTYEAFNFMFSETGSEEESFMGLIFDRLNQKYFAVIQNLLNVNLQDKSVSKIEDTTQGCESRRKRSSIECRSEMFEDTEVYRSQRTRKLLENLREASSSIMSGFMIRDLIGDLIKGDTTAVISDSLFSVGGITSGFTASYFDSYGVKLINSGKFTLGHVFRSMAPFLRRVTSVYVLSHLIRSVENYHNEISNVVDISTDSAFLGIDALEIGVEFMELAGITQGLSAVTGPLGAVLGTILIVGVNVYQTVKTVQNVNAEIYLNPLEQLEEVVRAFFHVNMNEEMQKILGEKEANQRVMKKISTFLQKNDIVRYFFTETSFEKNDTIIDLRNKQNFVASRTNPVDQQGFRIICRMPRNEKTHLDHVSHAKTFWQEVDDFVWNIKALIDMFRRDWYAVKNDLLHQEPGHSILSYLCHQSLGIENQKSTSDKAFFQLGSGYDKVHGFTNMSNIFNISDGQKELFGGDFNDKFIVNGRKIVGLLSGGLGVDRVDFSHFDMSNVLRITGRSASYNYQNISYTMYLDNVNEIIGRSNISDIVACVCNHTFIDTRGGKSSQENDAIRVEYKYCKHNLTIVLSSHTTMENIAGSGNFTYYISSDVNDVTIHIRLMSDTYHRIIMPIDSLHLETLNTIFMNSCVNIRFASAAVTNVHLKICGRLLQTVQILFMDSAMMTFSNAGPHLYVKSDEMTISKLLEKYDDIVQKFQMHFLAFSNIDGTNLHYNGMEYTLNGTKALHVIHADPANPSHFVCPKVETIILIKANSIASPKITIDYSNQACGITTLDFVSLPATPEKWEIFILPSAYGSDIILDVVFADSTTLDVVRKVGEVELLNVVHNFAYKKVRVVNHKYPLHIQITEPKIGLDKFHYTTDQEYPLYGHKLNMISSNGSKLYGLNEDLQIKLYPESITIDTTSNIVYLTSDDVELNQQINIKKQLINYNCYNINDTLLITNIFDNIFFDSRNLITIILEDFFVRPKLQTLIIKPDEGNTILSLQINTINAGGVQNVEALWQEIQRNDRMFSDGDL
uniref:Uncharacterized protein n=1 Tax=Romanomermis culicivorax TaxID=13658 RepID=A0A915KKY6_ROMCU